MGLFSRPQVFPSRFGSTCTECRKSIHVGTPIYMTPMGAVHNECPDSLYDRELVETPDPTAYGELCPTCWLYHRGGCA